ncbi:DUF3048 domain-containing protein [Peptoniphilus sp. GNH]|nr:DUF3048 domain-containing protein [Peptoniphilus sp. GNH]
MKKKLIFLLLLISSLLLFACKDKNVAEKEKEVKEEEVKDERIFSPLGGSQVDSIIDDKRVIGIMIDNHPDAQPQSGLLDAEVIYEFKAEGEFTRYLALYQKDYPKIVGPIRSARPYFVDTAAEYQALYIHWGGSEAGYNEIAAAGLDDLDGIALEGISFFRNKEVKKKKPHNGYTTDELILAQMDKRKISKTGSFRPFKFGDDEVMEKATRACDEITLSFNPTHEMKYIYDKDLDAYKIIRNGTPLIDEKFIASSTNEGFVTADNLIVEFASSRVTGPLGTLTIDHIGSGKGLFVSRGKVEEIIWEKSDVHAKTIFKDLNGNEITLKRGRTWVSVLDPEDPVTILPEEVKTTQKEEGSQTTNKSTNENTKAEDKK